MSSSSATGECAPGAESSSLDESLPAASGTIGGRQTRLAPDGSGCWPAEKELRPRLVHLEQKARTQAHAG